MISYALNYSPQNQTFGQQFLYDGVHDFEHWKKEHPKVDYSEYWHGIRDAFVERNFNAVERLTSDLSKAPLKDIANMTAGMSDNLRVAQTIASQQAWEKVSNIANGTGTIMSIDLETIGDITTKHQGANGINVFKDYTGVTEVGFHFRNYVDGMMQPGSETFTLAIGLNSQRADYVAKVVAAYDNSGYKALTETEQRLIDALSTYGHSENIFDVFTEKEISAFGGKKFTVLTDATEKSIADPLNKRAVHLGYQHLRDMWGGSDVNYAKRLSEIQNATVNIINQSMSSNTTAMISANSAFEATVLSDWGVDPRAFMNNSADLVYANTTIAQANGISVYRMQNNAMLSNGVTGNMPASVQNSAYAAGLGSTEYHHGGADARMQVDIATNKMFRDEKSYSDSALDGIDKLKNRPTIDYEKSYFYLRNGQLDKNKLDHAVVDGKATHSYSIRGQYYKIDKEHSGYTLFTPMGEGAEEETVYVLSMIDDNGTRISKQFATEQESLTWLTDNSSVVDINKYSKKRAHQREYQTELTETDWGRRMFDSVLNPNDTRITSGYEEVNGFEGLKKYLSIVSDIETQMAETGKTYYEIVTADFLKANGIKSNYQQRAFNYTYNKIQSEKSTLQDIVSYIDNNMKGANNLQKTVALRDIRDSYIRHVEETLGYTEYIPKPNKITISDALGIDIKVGEEYKRVNGDSVSSIQHDLNRIFKNSSQKDIAESIEELGSRGVLDLDTARNIARNVRNNTTPRNQYYNTIYGDIAIALGKITEPISTYENPISFFNDLTTKGLTEQQLTAIKNKLFNPTIQENILQLSETRFAKGKKGSITLSQITDLSNGSDGILKYIQADDIIKKASSIVFNISENPIFDSTLNMIAKELNYTTNQTKLLKEMFIAKSDGEFKSYAINGRSDLQSFIIAPSDANTSAFVLVTNQKHSTKVAEKLSTSAIEDYMKQNDLTYLSRADIAKIFEDDASVIELKKINRTSVAELSTIYGDAAQDIMPIFGDTQAQMSTVNQGRTLEKFVTPSLNVYADKNGVIDGSIIEAGEDYLTAYRKTGARFLDAISDDDFKKANKFITNSQNEVLKDLSSPSSYRGYNGVRTVNYNYNDISHAFYFDGQGLLDTLKLQVEDVVNKGDIDNPLYQLTKMIGLTTGDLQDTSDYLSISQAKTVLNSSGFNEFFAKNILTGNVLEDKLVSERISKFSNIKKEAFNKNILGMMIDEMHSSNNYGKGIIDALEKIQKASPHMTQILSESNVHKYMFSFLKPGEIIDLGLMNSSMRPTYQQVLNAIRFNPDSLNKTIMDELANGDVIVGPVSRTSIEQTILDTFGQTVTAPSGKLYNQEERIIMAPVKQMNDMDLAMRYLELDKEIANSTDEKLVHAYELFKKEHMSLYEGKFFGAPMLHNQDPFTSSDVKKVRIESLKQLQDNKTARDKIVEEWAALKWDDEAGWVPQRKITYGDTIAEIKGHKILWDGPDTYLSGEIIDEFINNGEAVITPANRMISDTKWMLQQEKGTVHFTLIDDEFLARNPIFDDAEEALKYMQQVFDKVSGYDDSIGYRPMFIANLSSYKHGTAIAPDSAFRVIVHEYEKAGELATLKDRLRKMEYFEDWDFDIHDKILISNQRNAKGADEAIQTLYESIMSGTSKVDRDIQQVFNSLNKNNIAYLETQRMLNNEIMGSKVMMDERMTQAIRLREIERGFSGERSFENIYIDSLKDAVRRKDSIHKGYYEQGSMVHSNAVPELQQMYQLMDELAEDSINVSKMRHYAEGVEEQTKTILAIKDSLEYYVGGLDVNEKDVLKVNINDVLKNLPDKNITHQDLQDLIFYDNGKPSNFLMELAGDKNVTARSIYLDFGTTIKSSVQDNPKQSFSGVLVPIFDVHTTVDDDIFFTKSQSSLVRFLNVYKESIDDINATTKISNAIEALYNSFAREMSPFDKDSLLYKTAGKILLPHSAQSLAQDEVAPIVQAMIDENTETGKIIMDSVRKEHEIRNAVANGDFSQINTLDNIIIERKRALKTIADRITSGDQSEELFKLSGLSLIGEEYKGFEIINGKKYFANAFEMNLKNMQRHGVDSGLIGYQLFEDAAFGSDSFTLTKFESNARFDDYLRNAEDIKERILYNLQREGINLEVSKFDDGKDLLRALNESITEDTSSSYMQKIYRSMSFIGEEYLQDVGIISREVWRPPVFSAQVPGRIFLNNTIGNNQIRALTGGSTSAINNVDFDGDMYMMSFSLNGNGGLRTILEDSALRQSYIESLKANNEIIAKFIEEGEALKLDSLTDISYYRLQQLKKFDDLEYDSAITEWMTNNNIILPDGKELTESQLLKAAHSKELRDAYGRFSSKGNMLTNDNVILASITARVRKDNIGSISTPNYKLRDTLLSIVDSIRNDALITETERKASFEILQDLTSISSSKLLEITEQTSIDVKHIFDAIDIAQTPKWAKGMSLLFGKDKEQGLQLMLEAVNKSTFNFKTQEELDDVFKTIINTDRKSLREEIEKLNTEFKALDITDIKRKQIEKQIAEKKFVLQFKALYDAPDLEHAKDFHKYVLRNKNASTRLVAEELLRIDELKEAGFFKGMKKGSVMDDMIELIKKASLDSRFHGNVNDIYFDVGSVANNADMRTTAYIIKDIQKGNVQIQEVSFDENGIMKFHQTDWLSNKGNVNYKKLNELLDERFAVHVNAYEYVNNVLTREGTNLQVSRKKISKTFSDMILDKTNSSFDNFFKLSNTGKYGSSEYSFVSYHIKREAIQNARELFDDYKYYASSVKNATGVEALIRDINDHIAKNYDAGKMYGLNESDIWYDTLARKYITETLNISEQELLDAHNERIALGSFDIDTYEAQKSFLNDNLYDIITSEKELKESFDVLEDLRKNAVEAKIDLPEELEKTIASRTSTISTTIDNIKSLNNQTVRDVQNTIYGLFKDTNQMDVKFRWNDATGKSVVGFGEYLGVSFSELSVSNINDILSVNISQEALNAMSDKERYAYQTTQKLLTRYSKNHSNDTVKGIVRSKIHDSVNVITENNAQFKNSFDIDFIRRTMNQASETQSKMKRKTLTDTLSNVKMPKLKTVGIAAASLAALGVVNNLLHNDKHKSPVSPEFSNDHNDPGFKNNSVESPQVAPPSKKTIYVDKPSGLQFKVSARTNNYISDVNNAKLIRLSNGGQANVYSQQDTSGVTDNWLANKFAELTN